MSLGPWLQRAVNLSPRLSAFQALTVSLPWQGPLKVASAGPGTQAGRKARDRWALLPAGVDHGPPQRPISDSLLCSTSG